MYDKHGGLLNFFAPNIPFATTTSGVLREIDIGGSSADHGEFICFKPCYVNELLFAVTGEAVSGTSVAPTVVFTKHPTPLSATGASAVGTLTIPSGTGIGKVVYKKITPVKFAVGDSILIAWTIGTGTPTGMGVAHWVCAASPEEEANNTDMIASA